ncbi:MAG: hypothetical protein EPN36_14000 [Rhodanobacteraceae bacterium]|nr:MAG: hypothetical protein EPN36_14000 [Rhodanobacteraceae bacterium]
MWYARAQQYKALAESLPVPVRRWDPYESKCDFEEREAVTDIVRRRLLRESEKCWAAGGKLDLERLKAEQEQGRSGARHV